ncbi:MAG TPA: MerR family DNA-binding transcriptional regulator [Acidimicrobiales bacterium]|nr:MerR family DNA-binding transcriptional regulator [Acidimicrobiales bacterium]
MAGVRTAEAAAELGVSPSTLQKWAQQGRVPCERTAGGHRRFDVAEGRRALDERAEPPTLHQLRRRRRLILRTAEAHGLTGVRVFGSVARDDAGPGSDVDLLVDAAAGVTVLDIMAAELDLERVIGAPVQIVTSGSTGAAALTEDARPL